MDPLINVLDRHCSVRICLNIELGYYQPNTLNFTGQTIKTDQAISKSKDDSNILLAAGTWPASTPAVS